MRAVAPNGLTTPSSFPNAMIPTKNLPTPSIRRLPGYLRLLKAARARGERVTSCTRIAEELGQQSVQVRKDLSVTGVSGRPKVGYSIDELIDARPQYRRGF